jgi:hypothetical protein
MTIRRIVVIIGLILAVVTPLVLTFTMQRLNSNECTADMCLAATRHHWPVKPKLDPNDDGYLESLTKILDPKQ